jgi:uncharacterized membrane protein YfcA
LHFVLLGILGLVVGGFGTIIGAGGGFLLLPLLAVIYPTDPADLLASISLTVVFFNALSGTIGYARMKRIDYRAGGLFAAATLPGAVLGALVTKQLQRQAFDVILAVTIIGVAVFILIASGKGRLIDPEDGHASGEAPAGPVTYNRWLGVGISAVVGFVSSLLGIGGGIIHVPALVFLLKFPVHVATATSHFVLAITAAVGTGTHLAQGAFAHGGVRRTAALAVGVVIGAQIGARLSKHAPNRLIMRCLAVALILVGIRIVWDDLRIEKEKPADSAVMPLSTPPGR